VVEEGVELGGGRRGLGLEDGRHGSGWKRRVHC
jgi:hypothetical protein